LYGGTERVVSYLTEELVRQGHDVTLFASGDSVTTAELVTVCDCAVRLDPSCVDPLARHILLLEEVYRQAERFDIIHFHIDYLHVPLSMRAGRPNVTTLHGRLDLPELPRLHKCFLGMPLVSISNSQRTPLDWAAWKATVYHGVPERLYTLQEKPGAYLAFLGRISPEKRVDRAIEIARRAGMPIRIAAKVDKVDREYFDNVIKPLLDDPMVEYIGEIGDNDKSEFLGGARALLFPIDWPEPFGLVVPEAMACGTPVIAWRRGSVPELVDDGVTGFIVDDIDEAVRAVNRSEDLDRRLCRRVFERRFSASRMARDYVSVYQDILSQRYEPAAAGTVECF
jgi:glycosyltransferase involved in cell wall biosynthesis